MKKLYFIGLMGLGLAVSAQTHKLPSTAAAKPMPAAKITADHEAPSPVKSSNTNNRTTGQIAYGKTAQWVKVGSTRFDRQTNSSVYKRIKAYADGKVSVIWTTSPDGSDNNFLGRGSGYNHFNGTTWGAISLPRIEIERAGYPSFDYNGTTEIIMSHRVDTNGKSGGLLYNTNGSIGSTTWSSENVLTETDPNSPTVLWPRTAIAGNYMHVVAAYTSPSTSQPDTMIKEGVRNPMVYSRYNMATSTWDITNITLPDYDSTRWFSGSADGYAIDANGTNVAIIAGGSTDDITLWKSTDNGTSWTSTIIDSFPYPAFNDQVAFPTDTPVVTDGSLSIALDATGKAHCFWGRLRVLNATAGDNTFSVFLGTNSIDYWYEGRPDSIVSIAGAIDENKNGTLDINAPNSRSRYGNAAFATMPYAIRNNDDIYMIYSAPTEDDLDAQGANFRDIYVTFSKDNGATWSDAQNLTATMGFNKEQMFGTASIVNGIMHLTFMESDAVGFFSATDNANKTGPFDIMYYSIPLSQIDDQKVGLEKLQNNNLFSIEQNYPNPFSGSTTIPVMLNSKADVSVSVMNMVGQVVYKNTFTNTPSGLNKFEINTTDFGSGIYFYSVEAGGYKATGKMIAR
jgi:hypothetical protein